MDPLEAYCPKHSTKARAKKEEREQKAKNKRNGEVVIIDAEGNERITKIKRKKRKHKHKTLGLSSSIVWESGPAAATAVTSASASGSNASAVPSGAIIKVHCAPLSSLIVLMFGFFMQRLVSRDTTSSDPDEPIVYSSRNLPSKSDPLGSFFHAVQR